MADDALLLWPLLAGAILAIAAALVIAVECLWPWGDP